VAGYLNNILLRKVRNGITIYRILSGAQGTSRFSNIRRKQIAKMFIC
jgi:hypothetical protein